MSLRCGNTGVSLNSPCPNFNVGRNFKMDSARCFLLSVAVTRSTFRVCVFVCAGVRELVRKCEMCDKKGTSRTYRSQNNGSSTCFHLGFYCANIGVGKKFRNMFSSALGFYCANIGVGKKFRSMFSSALLCICLWIRQGNPIRAVASKVGFGVWV